MTFTKFNNKGNCCDIISAVTNSTTLSNQWRCLFYCFALYFSALGRSVVQGYLSLAQGCPNFLNTSINDMFSYTKIFHLINPHLYPVQTICRTKREYNKSYIIYRSLWNDMIYDKRTDYANQYSFVHFLYLLAVSHLTSQDYGVYQDFGENCLVL